MSNKNINDNISIMSKAIIDILKAHPELKASQADMILRNYFDISVVTLGLKFIEGEENSNAHDLAIRSPNIRLGDDGLVYIGLTSIVKKESQ